MAIQLSEIPERTLIPDGIYLAKINRVLRTDDDVRSYLVSLTVLEPEDYKGSQLIDRITLGTEADPLCEDARTLRTNPGAQRLRALIVKSGAPVDTIDDDDEFAKELVGGQLLVRVAVYQNQGVYNPEKKGQLSNVVRGYFAAADREPHADESCWKRFEE